MKTVLLTICLLVFAGQSTAETEAAGTETADSPENLPQVAVTKINTSRLYIYDDEGEEIDELKSSLVKKDFRSLSIRGEQIEGIPVRQIDDDEGLVLVSLSQFDEPVWIETMSVELWPGNRLDCPEVTVGKSEIEQSGMTMGFGDHCD